MPGLPHYQNNVASRGKFEPFYSNLFEVTIRPPQTVSGGELLLEHVNKISGLITDRGQEEIEQAYKSAKRTYLKAMPTDTRTEPTIEFSLNMNDANELYIYKTLRDWWRTAWNPLTGEQGLKKDYEGSITVINYNRKGEIFWQRTFQACIPVGDLPNFDFDYGDSTAFPMEVKFKSDWFEENIV